MRIIESLDELKGLVGQEVAVSDWTEITQHQVNLFAEATGDHQWIHVDVERAKRESPFGAPVAHGFLTLSLLPMLMEKALKMSDVKMGVNYGLNRVRFTAPVPVGSRVRARVKLLEMELLPPLPNAPALTGAQMTWAVTFEREGQERPVCVAETISRRYS
ncbi:MULTISPECIES: MaoC family dehydratase [Ralstonia]|uniref:Probable enoyl-CoA hydratase 1 n=1 Tax=Ralstonia mannitolilytica TaxID=105219 RepID=A0AAJ5D444_9RALS|nr:MULTISPECIES: MaoC family dehydratase [Ralstonia]AJW45663.1 dehydratase [Ralstonia mannitolilytica]MBU9578254.1 MaoC family dehydratase [Ralstonia mannitolilytica]PLT19552.1 MaoC family dehydratase [Ralstonia mannitolilytica]QIF07838.1 MaoC family dehydratase [Ralstonia mannitolilytica]CAG2141892.1 putative enoyl-CoA hydratase 1 [Ralstonia mannitolilytica]